MNDISELLVVPKIGNLNIDLMVGKPILFGLFLIYSAIYFILTLILFYHWHAYGMKSAKIIFAESVFLLVSAFLFLVTAVSLSYY
jgi:hypothetical protein